MDNDVIDRLVEVLPRDLFLDLIDMVVARALNAHNIIQSTDLKGRRARGGEGLLRFHLIEQGFETVCPQYGGIPLEGNVIEGTDLRFFQPFMRFGGDRVSGAVLGLASIPERKELPAKNQSRLAGVTLNYKISPRLPLDDSDPRTGDVFVLFLTARDPSRSGHIDEIAIGIIDSDYKSYLFYETVEKFMERYAKPAKTATENEENKLVKLKIKRQLYKPPSSNEKDDDAQKES